MIEADAATAQVSPPRDGPPRPAKPGLVPNVAGALWYASVPVVAVFIGAHVARLVGPQSANGRTAVSLLAFAAVTAAVLLYRNRPHTGWIAAVPRLSRDIAAWVVVFVAFATLLRADAALPVATTALVWLGAALEEAVFRFGLPRRLAGVFAGSWSSAAWVPTAAQAIAQVVFAVSHFVPGVGNGLPVTWAEGVRLFAAGALYAAVAALGGLGCAITVHAAANVELLRSHDLRFDRVGTAEALAWAALALLLVRLVPQRARPQAPAY